MKRFRILFLILLAGTMTQSVVAQNFYLKVRGGYGIGVAKEGYYTGLNQGVVTPSSQETVYASLGAGIPLGISGGYTLSNNLAMELDANFLIGDKVRVADLSSTLKQTADAHTRQFQVSPNIVMSTGFDKKWSLYTKVGFVLPVGGKTYLDVKNTTLPTANFELQQTISGKPSLGYKGVLGVNYRINEKLGIFTELEGVHLKIKRNSSEVTKFSFNGEDKLAEYDTYRALISSASGGKLNLPAKEVEYFDKLENGEMTDGTKALSTTSPYGKLGLNIGLTWTF